MNPASPATSAAIGIVQRSRTPCSLTRIAVVYPPMAMNAPWPSEIWPVYPVTMFSPRMAMKYVPSWAPLM